MHICQRLHGHAPSGRVGVPLLCEEVRQAEVGGREPAAHNDEDKRDGVLCGYIVSS